MKKRYFIFILLLSTFLFASCAGSPSSSSASPLPLPSVSAEPSVSAGPSAAPLTVTELYPILENVHYIYEGNGNEYASYDVYIDYTSDTKVQECIDNGGTALVRVIEVAEGKVTKTYSRAETYFRENFLGKSGAETEILLAEPIEQGNAWTLSDGRVRTITGISVTVNTPYGDYSAVEVTTEGSNGIQTDYYAPSVGLVKTIYNGNNYEISSSLKEIEEGVPFTQSVRFFYPNVNDDKLYFKDREISFYTNDITRIVLTAAYKEQIPEMPSRVFSENTKINSLYLNQDGMLYIDLSKEFVTEMNAGSGYEAMILQSVTNTFGSYYDVSRVLLTIDTRLYESDHIALTKGEYLSVNMDNSVPLS